LFKDFEIYRKYKRKKLSQISFKLFKDFQIYQKCKRKEIQRVKNFAETPLGTLPILEIDGVKLSGQTAICRHLAWRFGLTGQSATTDALLDMFADLLYEAHILVFGSTDGGNDSNSNFIIADDIKVEEVCNRTASIIEKQLTNNNTSYLIGEEITWVDLMTYVFFNSLVDYGKNVNLDRYPSVKHMYERISQLTELGNYSQQKIDGNINATSLKNRS
uniref:glutathione transferase n=1 Tax=Elaeophora elaphi TaxID=1147741 RepID=A0A0R3RIS2_9BILA